MSQVRVYTCLYSFADGRRCRTPRMAGHYFCYDHARKEAQARAAAQVGSEIAPIVPGGYLSACDLAAALARLFTAVAQGRVKAKTANSLTFFAQTLLPSIQAAQNEYIHAFGNDAWQSAIRSFFAALPTNSQPSLEASATAAQPIELEPRESEKLGTPDQPASDEEEERIH